MKVVLDTNILVSGLLNPFGPPGDIVRMLGEGFLEACYDARILAEYEAVLSRPAFGFSAEQVNAILDQLEADGRLAAARPLAQSLPDPDDDAFLEIAAAAEADFLVTGNLRHFPPERRQGVRVVTPRQFVEALRRD